MLLSLRFNFTHSFSFLRQNYRVWLLQRGRCWWPGYS